MATNTSTNSTSQLGAVASTAADASAGIESLIPDRSRTFGEQRETTLLFADLRGSTDLAAPPRLEQVLRAVGPRHGLPDSRGDRTDDGRSSITSATAWPRCGMRRRSSRSCGAAPAGRRWACSSRCPMWLPIGPECWKARSCGWVSVFTRASVQVGNAGSQRVREIRPSRRDVHLASRVEAATKRIGLPFVFTAVTVAQLSDRFASYRVCRAELPGIEKPVDLFAIRPPNRRCTTTCRNRKPMAKRCNCWNKTSLSRLPTCSHSSRQRTILPPNSCLEYASAAVGPTPGSTEYGPARRAFAWSNSN